MSNNNELNQPFGVCCRISNCHHLGAVIGFIGFWPVHCTFISCCSWCCLWGADTVIVAWCHISALLTWSLLLLVCLVARIISFVTTETQKDQQTTSDEYRCWQAAQSDTVYSKKHWTRPTNQSNFVHGIRRWKSEDRWSRLVENLIRCWLIFWWFCEVGQEEIWRYRWSDIIQCGRDVHCERCWIVDDICGCYQFLCLRT